MHQQIIWVKARAVLTHSFFLWQHEPCFVGWVQSKMPKRKPPSNVSTIWNVDQRFEQMGIHPTQKPVELFIRPIEYHTDPGEIVYEPFSGSGTQIIAAERTGRVCYAVEQEPSLCRRSRQALGGVYRRHGYPAAHFESRTHNVRQYPQTLLHRLRQGRRLSLRQPTQCVDELFCYFHHPDHEQEAANARRLGGNRRRRQAARNRRTRAPHRRPRSADLEAALAARQPDSSSPFDVDLPEIDTPSEPSLN